jgi:hypothetical protein
MNADNLQTSTPSPVISIVVPKATTADVDVVLNDLEMMANDFSDHVQKIRLMQENGFFKYASKATRNSLLDGMLERVDVIDETTKVARNVLKRIKSERAPEEIIDSLLVSSVLPGRL